MEKRKKLTKFERGMIIGLHKGTHRASDISKILNIPRTTCQNVIKRFCEENRIDNHPRSERPHLLTERNERTLIRQVKENRKVSIEEITENFNQLNLTQISTSTSRRILHNNDYYG